MNNTAIYQIVQKYPAALLDEKDVLTTSGYVSRFFVVLFYGFKPRRIAALKRVYSLYDSNIWIVRINCSVSRCHHETLRNVQHFENLLICKTRRENRLLAHTNAYSA